MATTKEKLALMGEIEHRNQARIQLHAELTRRTGEIMACARRGDFKGMRRAHRAMKPVMKALAAKENRPCCNMDGFRENE